MSIIGSKPEQKRPCQKFIHNEFLSVNFRQVKSYFAGLKHQKKLSDFPYHYRMTQKIFTGSPDTLVHHYRNQELILLESQDYNHPSSVGSYLACRPVSKIYGYENRITVEQNDRVRNFEMNPWEAIRQFRQENSGWLFGYLGYDLKNYTEKLVSKNDRLIPAPDFYLIQPEIVWYFTNGEWKLLQGQEDGLNRQVNTGTDDPEPVNVSLTPMVTREDYLENVAAIKNDIAEGEYYELNYSYPMEGAFRGDPYRLYRKMREINPVPFGSFISAGSLTVCCASPERFLKKSGNRILSEPIKGTSARSRNSEEDQRLRSDLLNEKNKAENLMIVDLVRHDMSAVSKPGSVKVSKLFDIQTFGTVHQLISTVEAEVAENADPVDVIRSCFPMGSMTGAPKIRVMKAIEELEIYRRGIYSGAIGYIDPAGNFDFNVVIRSAIISDGKLIYPVGGAITSDSEAEEEWQETLIKSRALTRINNRQPDF
jgi:para-aminobenzoate synthetase component I